MLGAFFDDSGTHQDSKVVALGGLFGTEQQWDVFAEKWQALLDHPLPGKAKLPHFHSTDCRSRAGAFRDWTLAERDHITHLFREVIFSAALFTVAAAVNKIAWDELVTEEVQLGSPIELCFVKCMDFVIEMARNNKPGESIHIFLDQGTGNELRQWALAYKGQPVRYPEIDRITFAPVLNVIGLQGADMIAYESYQFGIEWFKDGNNAKGNAHFQPFRHHHLSMGLAFDADQIAEMVERAQKGPPPGWKMGDA